MLEIGGKKSTPLGLNHWSIVQLAILKQYEVL